MKAICILPLILFLFSLQTLIAQDCKTSYYFREGKEVTFIRYDKDGKQSGKEVSRVTSVSNGSGSATSEWSTRKFEGDGKLKEDGTAKVICENGNLKIGFLIPKVDGQQSSEAYFSYPAQMKAGQNLEAKMELSIKGKTDGKKMDVSFKVENRKVIGNDRVSTPAGTYDAVKIQFDMNVKFKVVGIGIPMKLKVIEWYSPGLGLVKTEAYNKDGQLQETTVLTSIK